MEMPMTGWHRRRWAAGTAVGLVAAFALAGCGSSAGDAQSGPTFPFVAGLMNQLGGQGGGVAAGENYLRQLKANGLHVYPTNSDTLHALETGQISYGMIQSSAATGELAKVRPGAGFDPKIVYLPKSTLLPSVIGIDKGGTPTGPAARRPLSSSTR